MDLEDLIFICFLITASVWLGYNIPDSPDLEETYVSGTPTYSIDGYLFSFREPSIYGVGVKGVDSDRSVAYTDKEGYVVFKSGRSLDDVDRSCVHEVAHNENPERRHPDNGTSEWFERQEQYTSRDVCEELKKRLLDDGGEYLEVR